MSTNKIHWGPGKKRPIVMGIININQESFYKNSRCAAPQEFIARVEQMLEDGAGIIDIGACSTRPGSIPISLEQEWESLREPLSYLKQYMLRPGSFFTENGTRYTISIDTFRSQIVERVHDMIGAFTINDISAGEDDPVMLEMAGRLNLPYIAMHKRGTPSTMQQMCDYPNGVVNEVIDYFKAFEQKAAAYGMAEWILDPGYGFAKTVEQNYELLAGIPQIINAFTPSALSGASRASASAQEKGDPGCHLKQTIKESNPSKEQSPFTRENQSKGQNQSAKQKKSGEKAEERTGERTGEKAAEKRPAPPILVGISRKGMIWKPLEITPEQALCGTAALNLQALLLGASIIRVHDVKEGVQCVKLYEHLDKYINKD